MNINQESWSVAPRKEVKIMQFGLISPEYIVSHVSHNYYNKY